MDRIRQHADCMDMYDSYVDILQEKIKTYGTEHRQTFSMDEKNVMIGVEAKSREVFSKLI